MVCKDKWAQWAQDLERITGMAAGSVDGAARCIKCDRPLLRDGRCVMGHAQETGVPAGESFEGELLDALLCMTREVTAEGFLSLEQDPRVVYAQYVQARREGSLGSAWVAAIYVDSQAQPLLAQRLEQEGRSPLWGFDVHMGYSREQAMRLQEELLGPSGEAENWALIPLEDFVQQHVPASFQGREGAEVHAAIDCLVGAMQDIDWEDAPVQDTPLGDPRFDAATQYLSLTRPRREYRPEALLSPFGTPDHLCDWAAQAAARELAENWAEALATGEYTPEQLLDDVDDVVRQLEEWKKALADGQGGRVEGTIPHQSSRAQSARLQVLDEPLSTSQLRALADEEGYVRAVVRIPLGEIIGFGTDAYLDLVSDLLTGTELLMDIQTRMAGHEPGSSPYDSGDLLLEVSGDVTEILNLEDDGDVYEEDE